MNTGKSALVNVILGDRLAAEGESHFEASVTTSVRNYPFELRGVSSSVLDTPGLRADEVSTQNPSSVIKDILKKCGEVDLIIYCCRLDQSVSTVDYEIIQQLTACTSTTLWKNAVFALTFANRVDIRGGQLYQIGHQLQECVVGARVHHEIACTIPFVPVAYSKDDTVHGHENWHSAFYDTCIERMKDQPKTKILKNTIPTASAPPLPTYLMEWLSLGTSASILVTGKTGTGKSSLINGMVGKCVAKEGDTLDRGTTAVTQYTVRYEGGVTITVWDSPGLQDGLEKEGEYIEDMQSKGCANSDLVFYCTKMNETRLSHDDTEAIRKLTKGLGKSFWKNALFVMTFANNTRPPPSLDFQSLNDQEKDKKVLEFFDKRLKEWEDKLRETVKSMGVGADVAANIPVVAAGYDADPSLPGCDNWLSDLWLTSITRMKESSQAALLRANKGRIKRRDQTKNEDFKKPIHEQPILYTPRVTYVAAPMLMAVLGLLVGGAVAGPVGAATGATTAGGIVSTLSAWLASWRRN